MHGAYTHVRARKFPRGEASARLTHRPASGGYARGFAENELSFGNFSDPTTYEASRGVMGGGGHTA